MSDVVVSEFITLDGVVEDPGGAEKSAHGGWAFRFSRGPEGDQFKFDELMAAGGLLLGRATYEGFAAAWPSISDETGFAERMNSIPKYVVSSTLERADWNNSTILRGDLAAEVTRLRREVTGDILVAGSATLVRSLMQHDLVDEYRLMVFPTVIGGGRRLFAEGVAPVSLRLVDSGRAGECLILTYHPARVAGAAGVVR